MRTPTSNPVKKGLERNGGESWSDMRFSPIFSRTRSFTQDSPVAALLAEGLHSSSMKEASRSSKHELETSEIERGEKSRRRHFMGKHIVPLMPDKVFLSIEEVRVVE
jgi:hypothetical protein